MTPKLTHLNERVAALDEKARDLAERARRLDGARGGSYAVVERSRCTGCRLCEQLCAARAIRVTYVAHVDAARCSGCGVCAKNCPQGAIKMAAGTASPPGQGGDNRMDK